MQKLITTFLTCILIACAGQQTNTQQGSTQADVAGVDKNSAIYEVAVNDGVSYQDVIDSLKSLSEGMNFVNPANFPIGEHMKLRGVDPQGVKEVHSFCNLSMGTEIILDHPEFLVFAPCRIALYEKLDSDKKYKLFIGLARPTFDLKNIKNPTDRALKSAQQLEDALILLVDKARKGDI
ncbi:MAG TPA: DUF302 domain-containing protein [Methylotenera sp.]|nr:DUF302 domain-containing protein [Methylotenera sp.]